MQLGWLFVLIFDSLAFDFDNDFMAFKVKKGANKPNYLEMFLWAPPLLHQHISDFALLIALGLHHIKLDDTQRMSLKSILLWLFHMFWRRSSKFKVLSSKHLSSFE